jgi:hypothetical protein
LSINRFIGNSYVDNVKTKDLVQLGQSLQGIAAGHITFVTVPTGVTDQNGDEPPRTADMTALFAAIINDDPLPLENDHNAQSLGTTPTTAPTTTEKAPAATPETRREQVTTTSPQDVTVQVSNSTGQTGLATTATNRLMRNGFNVMTPNDYPGSLTATTVFFSPGNEQAAATVASTFANAKVERVNGIGQVVQVVLGPDFSSVTAPPPSGSSISDQCADRPQLQQPDDQAARRLDGHQRRRHHLRVAVSGVASAALSTDENVGLSTCGPPTMSNSRNCRSGSARCAGWRGSLWSEQPKPCCRPIWCWQNR